MIYHFRQGEHHERIRLLVMRAYKRAEARQILRDNGVEIPTFGPDSWEAYEDRIYRMLRSKTSSPGGEVGGSAACQPDMTGEGPSGPPKMTALPGGSDAALRRPRRQKGQELVADGCKPPAVVETQPPGRPDPVFELDEETF